MEKEIKKIIEIEGEAQSLVSEGYTQAGKIRLDTLEELKSMEDKIIKMSEQKINQLYQENRNDADQKIAYIKEQTVLKMKGLEETVETNRELWESQIYNRVLGR